MPRVKSAGAVIFREEAGQRLYLLLQYRGKHWDFVKGIIEPKESEEGAFRREAKEETGLDNLEIVPGFKQYAKFVFRQYKELMTEEQIKSGKPVWVFKIVVFYIAKTQTKDIKLSWEHQDYKWLPFDQALKQTTYKSSKEILKKANEFLENQKL